jgi:tRNA (guanine37-N1)-methyltransferase
MGGIIVRIDVLTLFPGMFGGFLNESIMFRARETKKVEINIINFRDFSTNKHQKVDDYPFGGGAGMVLTIQPIHDALKSIPGYENALKILLSPQGKTFSQQDAYQLSEVEHIILLCGHYEGFDERIRSLFDLEMSIGDYVLTGGELAAMVIIDAVTRLIPGVLNKEESHQFDSFNGLLLDYPQYTRPRVYNGMEVPEILLNGHHANIERWRKEQQIEKTKKVRPDLFKQYLKSVEKNKKTAL